MWHRPRFFPLATVRSRRAAIATRRKSLRFSFLRRLAYEPLEDRTLLSVGTPQDEAVVGDEVAWTATAAVSDCLIAPDAANSTQTTSGSALTDSSDAGSSVAGAVPLGATSQDTSEYMLGDVWVTVVLLESDGAIDANVENWTSAQIASVKSQITAGLQWWEDTLLNTTSPDSLNDLTFHIDFTYADSPVATSYEPITRGAMAGQQLWIAEFLAEIGAGTGDYLGDMQAYDNAQRVANGADWSFTVFVVNSYVDSDGMFTDGYFAYAYLGGPFMVMTYDNDGWGINRMNMVTAHETGHIFYALDEYSGSGNTYTDYSGYYNTQNLNAYGGNPNPSSRVASMMADASLQTTAYANHTSSPTSLQMIGWKDTDADGIQDVLDVPLALAGAGAYDSASRCYVFSGSSSAQTLTNQNPYGWSNDITLNTVDYIQYSLDGGAWTNGNFYGDYSTSVSQSVSVAAAGTHAIAFRTVDEETGLTSNVYSAAFTVAALIADAGVSYVGIEGIAITLNASGSSDPEGDALQYRWDFDSDGTWDTDWSADSMATHTWNDDWSGAATVEVSDGILTATDTASVTVDNVAPTAASISGPTDGYQGVRGQERTFVLMATDVSPVDQASEFAFTLDWGDGTREIAVCQNGGTASHVFASSGIRVIKILAVADKDGGTTTFSGAQQTVTIGVSEIQGTTLAVGGTTGDDSLMVTDSLLPNTLSISVGRISLGTFSGISSVFYCGQGGTDAIQVFGTANDDSFVIDGDTITVNGIAVNGNSIESRLANGVAGNDTFTVSGTPSTAMTIDGGAGTADVLIGPDTESLWQLTAWGAGTLNTTIAFKNMENLTGGAQADAFQFGPSGAIAGKIDGAGGSDTLDYSLYGKAATVNLVLKTASGTAAIANLEQFTGSTAIDSFFGVNAATTWQFDGVASGVGTWTVGATVMTATLSSFENLKGGTKADIFRFTDAADGFGTINGSDGIDQFDYSLVTSPLSVHLQTRVASKVACLSSIEIVLGGTGSDTLIGRNVTNIWNITGVGAGTVAAVNFGGFENLVGGDGGDTLLRVSGSNAWTLTGLKSGNLNGMTFAGMETLTGGSGVDTFLLETAASGFSLIDGGAGTADVLIGPNVVNLWQLTAHGTGTLNTSTPFKNMENLTGGALADTFQISGSGAVFGAIDGGGGTADVLIGPDAVNVWKLTACGLGALNGSTAFRNMENLTGGALGDTFKLSGSGSIAGTLDGGTGKNVLDYSFFGTLGITVNLQTGWATAIGGGAAGGIANFGIVVGTMGADTLIGDTGNNVLIGGSGADILQGGAGGDLLIGGTRADQLNGGTGDDILIAGPCSYYPEGTRTLNLTAINAIMAEWTRTDLGDVSDPTGYLARYNHLIASNGGLNGSYLLNATTVQKDSATIDSLFGEADRDWFLASVEDLLPDRIASGDQAEELTLI